MAQFRKILSRRVLYSVAFVVLVGYYLVFSEQLQSPTYPSNSPIAEVASVKKAISVLTPQPKIVKQSAPSNVSIPSGSPVTLHANREIAVYECPEKSCKIIGSYPFGTSWEFSYAPSGDWYYVLTLDKQRGYVLASNLVKDIPNRCSPLTYKIGRIDGKFVEEGYNADNLLDLAEYAERQWEDDLYKELFTYDPDSSNAIDFFVDDLNKLDPGQDSYGRIYPDVFRNGAVGGFRIVVFSQLFSYTAQPQQIYKGGLGPKSLYDKNLITQILMHEFGHALGFLNHLDNPEAMLAKNSPIVSSYQPKLTTDDVNILKNWCNQ